MRRALGVAVLVVVLAIGTACRGDQVRFTAGGAAELPARWEGATLIVEAPSGPVRFPREDIRAVVPHPGPAGDWPQRRDAALAAGPDQRAAAALWAVEHALTDQGLDLFAAIHRDDPAQPAAARVAQVRAALAAESPATEPDPRSVLQPHRFRTLSGRHLTLLHQHEADEAAARLALLEQVQTTYHVVLAARGIVLPPPPQKLVVVWFAKQTEYQDFLRAERAGSFLDTHGYYHPGLHLVAMHDERSREPLRSRFRALESARVSARSGPPQRRRELDRQAVLLDVRRHDLEIATAAHELVHLLTVECGLAPRFEDFPVWLHEGLAMQFESVRGGRWAGVGQENAERRALWKALPSPPPLLPLLRDEGLGRGYHPRRYAAAWGLVHDAWQQRPDAWFDFLRRLRAPGDPRPTQGRPARTVAAFGAAFGADLDAYESAWHQRMDRLVAAPP